MTLRTTANDINLAVEVAGTTDSWVLRSFEDAPREEGELTVAADWVGKRFAWKLSAGLAASPDDGQEFCPDGSYVAMSLGTGTSVPAISTAGGDRVGKAA